MIKAPYTQHDQDIAQDDIDAMIRIKHDFFDLMFEQILDEMISPALHDANERAGNFNTLPISKPYGEWLKRFKTNVCKNQKTEKETDV